MVQGPERGICSPLTLLSIELKLVPGASPASDATDRDLAALGTHGQQRDAAGALGTLLATGMDARRDRLFDGFVVLHGTDTMAYTASALSFMLHRTLGKPVVFTGSQLPVGVLSESDARENLITALEVAMATDAAKGAPDAAGGGDLF